MELLKNLSEDMANGEPRIIVYDRGMLDRLPWIDYSIEDGSIPYKDGKLFKTLLESEFMKKYRPLTCNFLTSPKISILRKGKEGRLVNLKNVERFNNCLKQESETIKSHSSMYNFIKTDEYQGRIEEFILDTSEVITSNLVERMKNRENER